MDSDPYRQSTNYVDLLTSQHGVFGSSSQVPVFGTERAEASSVPQDTTAEPTEEERPPGVKAAKGKNKKNAKGEETLSQFQTMWEIKQKDLVSKDRITKMRLLDRLLAKQEPLDEVENDLRKKLILEHWSVSEEKTRRQ
ncbi:hypothetical protein YC2023_112566 [Brassica napus]